MADDYFVDIDYPRPTRHPRSLVGADDYVIIPGHLGGPVHRHHGYHSNRSYWVPPLYYTGIDFGDVAVNSDYNDPTDIPDAVNGPFVTHYNAVAGPALTVRQAWYRPARNVLAEFQKRRGHSPSAAETAMLAEQVKQINGGIARGEELTFEHHHGVLDFILQTGRMPTGYPNNTAQNAALISQANDRVASHVNAYAASHKGLFGGIASAIGDVVAFAGKPIAAISDVASHIPVIGGAIHAVLGLDPAQAAGGIASAVGRGERLDKAFLEAGKKTLSEVKEVAPYVSQVMSYIPGVGTGVAAAIAAGTALAEGKSISDAVINGLRGAVPGGQLGQTAFNAALAITHGDSISSVALDAIKNQLPSNVQQAVNTAIAAAGGKNVREAVLQAVRANLPPAAQKALETGIATGIARNVQSNVAKAITTPAAINKLASVRTPPHIKESVPKTSAGAKGFNVAVGALSAKGITPTALLAVRSKLNPQEQAGFDHGIKTVRNHFTQNTHASLVRGGIVTRGNWRAVSSGTKGAIPGRLVRNGQITNGHFVKVA